MNIYDMTEKNIGSELVQELWHKKSVRINRIVSQGETSGWYDQEEDEWVLLIDGEAKLEIEKPSGQIEKITLSRGDHLFIPAGQKHRVTDTSVRPPCIWLCVFIAPAEEK